jgi:hypothetical protein
MLFFYLSFISSYHFSQIKTHASVPLRGSVLSFFYFDIFDRTTSTIPKYLPRKDFESCRIFGYDIGPHLTYVVHRLLENILHNKSPATHWILLLDRHLFPCFGSHPQYCAYSENFLPRIRSNLYCILPLPPIGSDLYCILPAKY